MSEPFLITEAEARKLLSGADPEEFSPPIRVGRRKFWSRIALDRAVRKRAGLPVGEQETPAGSAYDEWKKNCA